MVFLCVLLVSIDINIDIDTMSALSNSTVTHCQTIYFLRHIMFLDQQSHRQVLYKNIQNTLISNLLLVIFGQNMQRGAMKRVFYSNLDS